MNGCKSLNTGPVSKGSPGGVVMTPPDPSPPEGRETPSMSKEGVPSPADPRPAQSQTSSVPDQLSPGSGAPGLGGAGVEPSCVAASRGPWTWTGS